MKKLEIRFAECGNGLKIFDNQWDWCCKNVYFCKVFLKTSES